MNLLHRIWAITLVFAVTLIPFTSRAAEDQTIKISGNDQMQFDVTSIHGKVGKSLSIELSNVGSLMEHNLVILKPGTDLDAFVDAATRRATEGYLPGEPLASQVLVASKLIAGGDFDKISFTPKAAGVYEYICTYPGHFGAGMRGTITVD